MKKQATDPRSDVADTVLASSSGLIWVAETNLPEGESPTEPAFV
jgi:hypothetical protein